MDSLLLNLCRCQSLAKATHPDLEELEAFCSKLVSAYTRQALQISPEVVTECLKLWFQSLGWRVHDQVCESAEKMDANELSGHVATLVEQASQLLGAEDSSVRIASFEVIGDVLVMLSAQGQAVELDSDLLAQGDQILQEKFVSFWEQELAAAEEEGDGAFDPNDEERYTKLLQSLVQVIGYGSLESPLGLASTILSHYNEEAPRHVHAIPSNCPITVIIRGQPSLM